MKKAYEPAFPMRFTKDQTGHFEGLTKREYFAAMAMQGLLSCRAMEKMSNNMGLPDVATVAQESVAYADYLLQQLES